MRRANYAIAEDDLLQEQPLLIEDIGPHGEFMSVTNAAELVVEELVAAGHLPPGRELHYYDSEGQLDAILVKGGKFAGFAPVRE